LQYKQKESDMKAVGYFKPSHGPDNLQDVEIAKPSVGKGDLLIAVKAVSVNPVDYKVRQSREANEGAPVILGWDGAGVVEDVGDGVTGFKKGDEVFYAGDLTRQGSNAEFQTVDHRLVGLKPKTLSFADAASLPLTSLTAHEGLFEKLKAPKTGDFNILFIGGAGGVGSIGVQLAKTLTEGKVFATAGRGLSRDWLTALGADGVIDRQLPIREEMKRLGVLHFDYVFSTTHTAEYLRDLEDIVRPFGTICLIDDPAVLDIAGLKKKSISVAWELMFTKSMYRHDMESQGQILNEVARLAEQNRIRPTTKTVLEGLKSENFKQAHASLETGGGLGKIVIKF
jgi:zinc-binding alcohol dehydrogenase family protein